MNTQIVVDLTQSLFIRVDNQSGEVRTQTHLGIFVCELRIPFRFSPCKTHSRQMAQTSGLDPKNKVKACFDYKMFDITNCIARLNREDGWEGCLHMRETFSMASQGALEIFSITGHPPSLVRDHFSSPRMVAKPGQRDGELRSSPQRPQYPNLYRCLKCRLGRSLRA